jgi:hypothetical protein
MRCDRCGRDAIVLQRYSGLRLCGDHLRESVDARARRTLRARGWIQPGDRIAVALSGGPGSSSLLHFLSANFGMRRDLSLVAITVDEGPRPGRDMGRIGGIAGGMGVEWVHASLPKASGDALEGMPAPGGECLPFPASSRLRDLAPVLEALARRVKATKIALGTNLEVEAASVFLHVIGGEGSRLVKRPQPVPGVIPWIRPFLRIPGDELDLYARFNVPGPVRGRPSHTPHLPEGEAGRLLADCTARHPSAMFSLVNLAEALSEVGGSGDSRSPGRRGASRLPAGPSQKIRDRVRGHG